MSALLTLLLNWRTWVALAVVLVLAATHWFAYSKGASSRDAELAQLKAAYAAQQAAGATSALTAQQKVDSAQEAKTQAVAAADQHATKEVSDAKQKHQADRAALRSGALGVRLNGADCAPSARSRAVPAPAATASVADAAAGELPQSVGQSVLDLRFDIERDAAQIDGLQAYIRAIAAPVSAASAQQ